MTLKEAGELYEKKKTAISDMKQDMKYLAQSIKSDEDPLRGVCSIRKETARNILEYLIEYLKKLEIELDLNV